MVAVKTLPSTSFKLVPQMRRRSPRSRISTTSSPTDESQTETADIDAPIVFVGYGINAPEYKWDDYKGLDLKGKVALVFVNEPRIRRSEILQRQSAHLLRPLDLQV